MILDMQHMQQLFGIYRIDVVSKYRNANTDIDPSSVGLFD